MSENSSVSLSIVSPIYNEEEVVEELIHRCVRAGEATGLLFEYILVDDQSQDSSLEKIKSLAVKHPIKALVLPENVGQFGATKAGILAASGDWVVVLDGDLQDPPELIPEMWQLAQEQNCDVVFAVKTQRVEIWWFQIGQWFFHRIQSFLGSGSRPSGAGSYCLMRGEIAKNSTVITQKHLNLASILALQRLVWKAVSYTKSVRYDGSSRVGFIGLCKEAIGSMSLSGALHRILFTCGFCTTPALFLDFRFIITFLLGLFVVWVFFLALLSLLNHRRSLALLQRAGKES